MKFYFKNFFCKGNSTFQTFKYFFVYYSIRNFRIFAKGKTSRFLFLVLIKFYINDLNICEQFSSKIVEHYFR